MAAASCLLSEEQFLCSICLDVFTDPVTIPCGHNFCKPCITEHWNTSVPSKCPMCKKGFPTRPDLNVNIFISEMVAQFRQEVQLEAQVEASSSNLGQQEAKPGEVPCDVCTTTKVKALKSCLVCLVSYCDTHLEPHQTVPVLRSHQLIEPVENLEGRICRKHNKPLELFCQTDQTCVCSLCPVLDHKMHEFVPLREECELKKAELEEEIQEMLNYRHIMINAFKESVDFSRQNADKEMAEGVQVFTSLMGFVERGLEELSVTIEETHRTAQKHLKDSIEELEKEICELEKRSKDVGRLSLSEDHLHLLQSLQSLKSPLPSKDWLAINFSPQLFYAGTVMRAVAQLENTLSQEMKKLVGAELKRVQQYAVEVTLDPETAHPSLILSDDGKQVSPGEEKQNLPNNLQRFSINPCVLAKQSFSFGRFYFEVQVKGKTAWDCGVARESINRTEDIPLSPEDGYWAIWLRKRMKFKALNDPPVCLFLKSKPNKVGVFVDYNEGLVSFYDVDAAVLIYSFTGCSFKDKLYPYFNPGLTDGGKNSAPLILTPVNHAE